MTTNRLLTAFMAPVLALLMGGCAGPMMNERPSLQRSHVKPVLTEHSLALACLGDLIDRSGKPRLSVYVRRIDDDTVPDRFRERRLSLGGQWWLHTAINKIGSSRVVSVTSRKRAIQSGNHIEISGAWTQDDIEVGRSSAEFDIDRDGSQTDVDFFAGTRTSFDVIAGDFISVRNGQVIHATAISLALGSSRDGLGLRIEEGAYDVAFDLSNTVNEGPQFAQRRIAEAAALVHVSRAFDIDYRPCIEIGWASAAAYQESIHAYLAKSDVDRNRLIQAALAGAGYRPGEPDGIWGNKSARALMRFQGDRGLPVTGRPSAEIYALLIQFDPEGDKDTRATARGS